MKPPKLGRDLWLVLTLKMLGNSNVQLPFIILFYVRDLHATPAFALQFFAICGLFGAFLEIPTGWFADRYGRKLSITIGSVLLVGAFALYATAKSIGPHLVVGVGLAFMGQTLTTGADSALASDLCDARFGHSFTRDRAYTHFETMAVRLIGASQALGCVAGALLVWLVGLRATMWGQAAAYVPMVFLAILIHEPSREHSEVKIRQVAASLPKRRRLLAVLAFSAVITTTSNLAWKLVPLYFTSIKLNGSNLAVGSLGFYFPFFLASMYLVKPALVTWWRQRLGWYNSLAALLAIGVGCYVLLGLTTSILGLAAACLLPALVPMYRGGVLARIRGLSESSERATIMSLHRTGGWACAAILGIAIGGVVGLIGLSDGLLVTAGLLAIIGAVALFAMILADRRPKRSNAPQEPQLESATEAQS